MTTTIKTIAMAAMMTVFTATAFANNNNHKYNNNHNNHAPKVEATHNRGNANNKITVKEYNNAKHCNCKTCKEIVKAYEKQNKQNKHNNKNHCTCNNCQKQVNKNNNNYMAYNNTHNNNNGQVKVGRR